MRHIVGIHAVAAALSAVREGSGCLDRVLVAQGARNSRLEPLVAQCRSLGVPVRFEPRAALQRAAGTRSHQNIVAISAASPYRTLNAVLDTAPDECILVMLDSIQDPHNLGAIIRTADAAGAAAVLIPERRSASLTESVAKAAAGALESLPVVRVKNLGRALGQLQEAGFWIYGFEAEAEIDHDAVEYAPRCTLIFGGERRGLRPKISERCDYRVRIPLAGRMASLNVSVAAGVGLFEVCRQRRSL